MINSSRRYNDAVGVASNDAPNMLHNIFQSRGPPCYFSQSLSYISASQPNIDLSIIQEMSLNFAEEIASPDGQKLHEASV